MRKKTEMLQDFKQEIMKNEEFLNYASSRVQ
jgi:hypothetical protein